MESSGEQFYQFGEFRVDPVKRLLLKEGSPIPVPSKAFDTLMVLLENSGQVVDRDYLMRRLWPDTFVEEVNLNVHISSLRKALGENPSDHRFIVTVPRRGYSFVAQVSTAEDRSITSNGNDSLNEDKAVDSLTSVQEERSVVISPTVSSLSIGSRIWSRRMLLYSSLLVVLIASVLVYLWGSFTPKTSGLSTSSQTIAVLPFKQLSLVEEEYFGLGIADALITKLSNIKSLTVRPMSAVLRYNAEGTDSLNAGRELRADLVLEGKIQREGERLRVTIQMLRVSDGESVWADSFDENLTNIFSVQDSISRRVADAVSIKLNAEERELLTKRYTENTEAYKAYIKGRYFWNKRSGEGLLKATEYFNQAIELDPTYALAYSGLADSYILYSIYAGQDPRDFFPKAKAAALKALEIDDSLAEAHNSLAYVKTRFEWDWAGAEAEFRRALDLNPNYATAHHWYGEMLMLTGRTEEAVAEIERALELDPLSVIINSDLAWALYYARDYGRAIKQARKTLEMNPDFVTAHLALGISYEQKGKYEEALAAFKYKNMERMYPFRIAHILTMAGRKDEAAAITDKYVEAAQKNPLYSHTVATLYAGFEDKDQAIYWLEKAYHLRQDQMLYIKIDPYFDPIRSDPRFQDILRRMGLDS